MKSIENQNSFFKNLIEKKIKCKKSNYNKKRSDGSEVIEITTPNLNNVEIVQTPPIRINLENNPSEVENIDAFLFRENGLGNSEEILFNDLSRESMNRFRAENDSIVDFVNGQLVLNQVLRHVNVSSTPTERNLLTQFIVSATSYATQNNTNLMRLTRLGNFLNLQPNSVSRVTKEDSLFNEQELNTFEERQEENENSNIERDELENQYQTLSARHVTLVNNLTQNSFFKQYRFR